MFDPRTEEFSTERAQLAGLLTPEQYCRAQASILNAHYTDPAVVAVIWQAMRHAGFTGGRVLEPSFMRNMGSHETSRLLPRLVAIAG